MRLLTIHIILCLITLRFSLSAIAQPSETRISRQEYIETYKDIAIREMLEFNIPASIKLAQGILESGDGNSPLAKYAKNHFGIKCHKTWDGPTFIQDDDEKNECFRKYSDVEESYRDHSLFLKGRKWYADLFELKITDYKGWAYGLKKAGYATHPKYAELLIEIIEKNELYRFDKLDELPKSLQAKNSASSKKPVRKNYEFSTKNNIRFIVAQKGDTYYKIARRYEMGLWQIYKYNDLEKSDICREGELIYLQPKRRKGDMATHTITKGETIRSISQMHGIKLKRLYKLNNLPHDYQPKIGEVLKLK
ncbi:MAG: glucosaminidase domain-containing protein [Bacteroidia bacterium]